MTKNLPIAELDHLPINFLSFNRLKMMRKHAGRRDIPIVVRRGKRALWELVDGHHRLAVARENGEAVIFATDQVDEAQP